SSPGLDDLGSRIVPAVVISTIEVGFGASIPAIPISVFEDLPGVFRRLLFRKKLFARELTWPFQGRKGGVGPNSLKVRLAVGRTWRSPRLHRGRNSLRFLRGRRPLAGGGCNRKRQRTHCSEHALSNGRP